MQIELSSFAASPCAHPLVMSATHCKASIHFYVQSQLPPADTIRYEKVSSISPCQAFFVLLRFFCFDSSAVVDSLEGSMTRFFTITAWRDEVSTLVDDGNGGDGLRGMIGAGCKVHKSRSACAQGRYIHEGIRGPSLHSLGCRDSIGGIQVASYQ